MDTITIARLTIGAVAVVVWGCGTYADVNEARIAGMAMLAVVLMMRFLRRKPKADDTATE